MKRWLRRVGIGFGILALIVSLFYVEEDWRGARIWAKTKAEYEAQGFSFDPKALIPPPVPDEQNFAASEIWKKIAVAEKGSRKSSTHDSLIDAANLVSAWQGKYNHPPKFWRLGEKLDSVPVSLFAGAQDELDALYLASRLPYCQFKVDFKKDSIPLASPEYPSSAVIALLYEHSLAALASNQSHLALNDLLLNNKLASATADLPTIVSTVIGCGAVEYMTNAVAWQGLECHSWTEDQLVVLQKSLAETDLLKSLSRNLYSEVPLVALGFIDLLQNQRHYAHSLTFINDDDPWLSFLLMISPSGWFDMARSQVCRVYISEILPVVDLKARRIYTEKLNPVSAEANAFSRSHFLLDRLLGMSVTPVAITTVDIAKAQTYLDLARVACGLERYWLVNKKYPATLAELEPKFIDAIPHDICNGEPLHYRVEADGNYTLYSVGFNGTDDGGKVVLKKDSDGKETNQIDSKQGDWVWPRLKKE